jgi:hypothetical protein
MANRYLPKTFLVHFTFNTYGQKGILEGALHQDRNPVRIRFIQEQEGN